jgi:hypothetical protein
MVDQSRGVGVGLLQDAIRRMLVVADQAGVRALLAHPIDEAASRFFYLRFGFEASPAREQQWRAESSVPVRCRYGSG